jgi:hypothetical protein
MPSAPIPGKKEDSSERSSSPPASAVRNSGSTAIERVADALREACRAEFGSDWNYDVAWTFARAATSAMRETTRSMRNAGYTELGRQRRRGEEPDEERVWMAMIDAALDEFPAAEEMPPPAVIAAMAAAAEAGRALINADIYVHPTLSREAAVKEAEAAFRKAVARYESVILQPAKSASAEGANSLGGDVDGATGSRSDESSDESSEARGETP